MRTVNYGVIIGLVLAILTMLIDWLLPPGTVDFALAETLGYTSMVVCMSLVYLVLRKIRSGRPQWSFGTALRIAVITVTVASLVFGATLFIYFQWLQPESLARFFEFYKSVISDSSATPEVIKNQLESLELHRDRWLSPAFQSGVMTATVYVLGLVIALLSALLTRKQALRA